MNDIEKLKSIRARMERIAGSWDGDEPGIQEERAGIANDAIEHIDSLMELIKALDE